MPPTQLAAGQPLAIHIPNPFSWGAGKITSAIVSGITKAINAFFGGLVKDALNPLLSLLGQTLLTTPDPSRLPRVGTLWENSREIAVAAYALLILIAAILVMAYETVQTRHSIKEIAPRVVVGFLTANMSLLLAGKAVGVANALSVGVMSGGVDPHSAAATLTSLVMNAVTNGGIFLVLISIGLAVILLAILVCYVIRVALTVILMAGAPLALMCHALPQTEGIARWWWRAFTGVLAIQLAQSLTLVAALNVFLSKGVFTFFGPTGGGLVDLIVTLALLYILWKIPFWILHSIQGGGGRSFIGSAIKGVVAYKTLGMLGLGRGASAAGGRSGGASGPGRGLGPGGPGPRPGGPRHPAGDGPSAGSRLARPRAGQLTAASGTQSRARTPSPRGRPAAGRSAQGSIPGQRLLPLDLPGADRGRPERRTSATTAPAAAARTVPAGSTTSGDPAHRTSASPRLTLPRPPVDLPRPARGATPQPDTLRRASGVPVARPQTAHARDERGTR